jgi:DNA (cytosine-5)-methyltransferase 1
MQVISLFTGIGGFDLAAQWAGWQTVALCEKDKHAQKVLRKHWPDVYLHDDIFTLNHETLKEKSSWQPEQPTIVVGGFPCQPFSVAGKRKGADDDRYLWPEMLRIIRETQPEWVCAENVPGIISMQDGLVLEKVIASLETEGYEVQPLIIPACAVGAWHRRDRIWIIAHANYEARGKRERGLFSDTRESNKNATDTLHDKATRYGFNGWPTHCQPKSKGLVESDMSSWWEAECSFCGVPDGISAGVDRGRAQRLKQLGNAIVPQVVYQLFNAINQSHNEIL